MYSWLKVVHAYSVEASALLIYHGTLTKCVTRSQVSWASKYTILRMLCFDDMRFVTYETIYNKEISDSDLQTR